MQSIHPCICPRDGYDSTCRVHGVRPPPSLAPNPKTLMGRRKVPVLSVVPACAILREGEAMSYGAFEAPRADGGRGYGPYNWRDQAVEYMTYVDAAIRHLTQAVEGEDVDPQSGALHLAPARASIGILIDALEHGKAIDNRPRVRNAAASHVLDEFRARTDSTTRGV